MKFLIIIISTLSRRIGDIVNYLAQLKIILIERKNIKSKTTKYLFVPKILDESEVTQLIHALNNNQAANETDLIDCDEKIQFKIMLKYNGIFYWKYPKSVLNQYKYVANPMQDNSVDWRKIIDKITPIMKNFMGTEVVIDIIELYITKTGSGHVNADFHTDGDHPSGARLLIYLSSTLSITDGPLQIKTEDNTEISLLGDMGSGVLFYNSKVLHRGLSPKERDRYCINFKFYPTILNSRVLKQKKYLNRIATLFRI